MDGRAASTIKSPACRRQFQQYESRLYGAQFAKVSASNGSKAASDGRKVNVSNQALCSVRNYAQVAERG